MSAQLSVQFLCVIWGVIYLRRSVRCLPVEANDLHIESVLSAVALYTCRRSYRKSLSRCFQERNALRTPQQKETKALPKETLRAPPLARSEGLSMCHKGTSLVSRAGRRLQISAGWRVAPARASPCAYVHVCVRVYTCMRVCVCV